jgi:hypothetical protein
VTSAHARWDELAAGHALNVLEPEDEHAFLDHLRGCDRCRDELASLKGVTAELAYAAEPAEPPADLGRRILDAAAAERPAVFAPDGRRDVVRRLPARPRKAARGGRVWHPTFRLASLGTAAAVVAVVALGGWNLQLRADSKAKQTAIARRTAALQCMAAPESAKFPLRSVNEQRGRACIAGDRAYLVVDRLAANDRENQLYVLWWQDSGNGLHAVEGFDVPRSGTAVYELPISVAQSEVRAMAISLEPGRRVPSQPTRRIAAGAVES